MPKSKKKSKYRSGGVKNTAGIPGGNPRSPRTRSDTPPDSVRRPPPGAPRSASGAAHNTSGARRPASAAQRSPSGTAARTSSGTARKPAGRGRKKHRERLPRNVEPFTFEEVKREKPRRRRSNGRAGEIIYRTLMFVMIFAALIFIISVFFKVDTVEVVGANHCSPGQIVTASGVLKGDKLFFINKIQISENIFAEFPYVKTIKVRQQFPNKVIIEITERKETAKLVSLGISYIIDEDAYLLGYTALESEYRLPVINGVTPSEFIPGKQLKFDDPLMLISLKDVLSEIIGSGWMEYILEINLEKIYSISFNYANRYTVIIGDTSNLERKFAMLTEILERLSERDQGTIYLSNPERAWFNPNI